MISKKYEAIIMSDFHLGTKDCKSDDIIKFLDEHPTKLLILNGDIIDQWALNRGSKWKKSHTNVVSKILKISNHCKVIWIKGNHDEDLLGEFHGSIFGNIHIMESYKLKLDENNHYYVFHGDIIDIFITKYRFLSIVGSVAYDIALWMNRWYNRYRRLFKLPYKSISQKMKGAVKIATNHINNFESSAIRLAKKHNCKGVICGHIHNPADVMIDDGHYLNSGDWVENRTAILIDSEHNISIYKMES